MEINVLNAEGKISGKVQWPEHRAADENVKVNRHLVHEVVRAYLANQRSGTHSTLTRTEVSGGGKKPWKQKHTGRARSGSSRSPLWRGGGIIFGPKPRSYRIDMPKQKIRTAFNEILAEKVRNGEVVVSDKPVLEKSKTREVSQWLKKLALPKNCLLVVDKKDEKLNLAARNLQDLKIIEFRNLHPYYLMDARKVIFTPEAVKCL